jgi:DNA-directed RNA polymerase subunit beta
VSVDCDGQIRKVVGNNFVDASAYLPFDPKEAGILEMVHLPTLKRIMESVSGDELFDAVKENIAALVPKHIIPDDIVSSVNYMLGLPYGSAPPMISTIWATAACAASVNCSRTRSASA